MTSHGLACAISALAFWHRLAFSEAALLSSAWERRHVLGLPGSLCSLGTRFGLTVAQVRAGKEQGPFAFLGRVL